MASLPAEGSLDDGDPSDVGPTFQSVFDNGADGSDCNSTPPGNWGIVDFDGGSNPTGDIASWTEFGYPGAVKIPDPAMPGDPGANFNSSQIKDALAAIVDQQVLLPISDEWSESGGSNANFNAVGVLPARICGAKIKSWQVEGDCWDQSLADPIPGNFGGLVLQWRASYFATSYESDGRSESGCDISDPACALNREAVGVVAPAEPS